MRGDLPAGLNEIIMMAIAKDPANRFQTADAFRAALSSVEVSHLPASNTTRLRRRRSSGKQAFGRHDAGRHAAHAASSYARSGAHAYSSAGTFSDSRARYRADGFTAYTRRCRCSSDRLVAPPSWSRTSWLAIGAVLGVAVIIAAACTYRGITVPMRTRIRRCSGAEEKRQPDQYFGSANGDTSGATGTSSKPLVSIEGDQGKLEGRRERKRVYGQPERKHARGRTNWCGDDVRQTGGEGEGQPECHEQ